MTNRIDRAFNALARRGKKALVLFVTAGDPSLGVTRQVLRFCDECGVDCVEIGVPFSDPLADGPVIQAASRRALRRGVNLKKIFALLRAERRRGLKLPIALMSSYNPLFRFGVTKALRACAASGVDGLIVPDLPAHESARLGREAEKSGIREILMVAPTTTAGRRARILRRARGFVYYVSLTGVTGARRRSRYPFRADLAALRRKARLPVCVGFGISDPGQARAIARFSDGVIVGSAVVAHLNHHSRGGLSAKSRAWVRAFLTAVRGAR